jgi:hypothetical protein
MVSIEADESFVSAETDDLSQLRIPFSKIEELAIINECSKRQKLLAGRFTPSHTKADRRHAWTDLAAAVNR